jgi:hypothetical protein
MAKKTNDLPIIRCSDCKFAIGEVVNFLVGCLNKQANPNNAKMGTYPRQCEYFKLKR